MTKRYGTEQNMKAGVWALKKIIVYWSRVCVSSEISLWSEEVGLILAFTRQLCLYAKIKKSAIIAKFRKALPSFKYTDALHGKTIGSGAFGTVKLGYIVSMQQRAAIKSFCDKSSNQHILAEGLVYSEMSGNVNFPLFYGMLDNRCLITEYVSSSETLKIQLSEQNYSVNSKEVCIGIVRAIYSLHLKGIKYTMISTAITY